MRPNILLTGDPGCGKTTLIRRVITQLDNAMGGFYTQEIRIDGNRRGFKMITLDGEEGILAHVDIAGPPRVSRYGVDVAALEAIGLASVRRALTSTGLIVIDELGPMEFFSAAFQQVVLAALDSDQRVLGTIVKRSTPFGDQIKARSDVTLITVYPNNRNALVDDLLARLRDS
ncbi:MAG: NTPase [Anaerolineae bacterium]|nr:NTPase [Anaerolineae bacterium]